MLKNTSKQVVQKGKREEMTKEQLKSAKQLNKIYAKVMKMSYKEWLICHLEWAKEEVKNGRKQCQLDIEINEALLKEIA